MTPLLGPHTPCRDRGQPSRGHSLCPCPVLPQDPHQGTRVHNDLCEEKLPRASVAFHWGKEGVRVRTKES